MSLITSPADKKETTTYDSSVSPEKEMLITAQLEGKTFDPNFPDVARKMYGDKGTETIAKQAPYSVVEEAKKGAAVALTSINQLFWEPTVRYAEAGFDAAIYHAANVLLGKDRHRPENEIAEDYPTTFGMRESAQEDVIKWVQGTGGDVAKQITDFTKPPKEWLDLLEEYSKANIFTDPDKATAVTRAVLAQTGIAYQTVFAKGLGLVPLMYEESVKSTEAKFKENGLEYDATEYFGANAMNAVLQAAAEKVEMAWNLKVAGKSITHATEEYIKRMAFTSKGGQALKYLTEATAYLAVESGTEALQSTTQDVFTNTQLIDRAEKKGLPVLFTDAQQTAMKAKLDAGEISPEDYRRNVFLITPEQMAANAERAAQSGFTGALGFKALGAKGDIQENVDIASMRNATLDAANAKKSYDGDKERIDMIVQEKTDKEFDASIQSLSLSDLLIAARSIGFTEKVDGENTRDVLTNYIKENKLKVPGYQNVFQNNIVETVSQDRELKPISKQIMKWMLQGDSSLTHANMGMNIYLFNGTAKRAGYKDANDYLEQKGELSKPIEKGVEFEQVENTDILSLKNRMSASDRFGESAKDVSDTEYKEAISFFKNLPETVTLFRVISSKDLSTYDMENPGTSWTIDGPTAASLAKPFKGTHVLVGEFSRSDINTAWGEESYLLFKDEKEFEIPVNNQGSSVKNLKVISIEEASKLQKRVYSNAGVSLNQTSQPNFSPIPSLSAFLAQPEELFYGNEDAAITQKAVNSYVNNPMKIVEEDERNLAALADRVGRVVSKEAGENVAAEFSRIREAGLEAIEKEKATLEAEKKVVADRFWEESGEKNPLEYPQTDKTASTEGTVRGRTQFLAEGKFIIDLFETGDIITLAHELAHAFSPIMNEQAVDVILSDYVDKEFKDMDEESKADFLAKTKKAWTKFVDGDYKQVLAKPRGEEAVLLRGAQEHLAYSFQNYLSKEVAPSKILIPIFRIFKQRYTEAYKDARDVGLKVNINVARAFDNIIAKDVALIREDTAQRVTINGVTFNLYKGRPQLAALRVLQKHMQRAKAETTGLKGQVEEYIKTVLNEKQQKNAEVLLSLEKVRNIRDAEAVIEKVDEVLAFAQNKERRDLIAKIKNDFSKKGLGRLTKVGRDKVAALLDGILLEKPFVKTLESLSGLEQHIMRGVKENSIEESLYQISSFRLNRIKDLYKKGIWELELPELQALYEALDSLASEDESKQQRKIATHLRRLENKYQQGLKDFDASPRTKRGNAKQQTIGESRMIEALDDIGHGMRIFRAMSIHPWRLMRSSNIPVLMDLAQGVKNGVIKRREMHYRFKDALEAIYTDDYVKSRSAILGDAGYVKINVYGEAYRQDRTLGKDAVKVIKVGQKRRIFKDEQLNISKAELMTFYGYTFNKDAFNSMIYGGIRVKERPTHLYKFRSEQELNTIFDEHLTNEDKQVVIRIMTEVYGNIAQPELNALGNRIWGQNIADEENYLPMRSEALDRAATELLGKDRMTLNTTQFAHKLLSDAGFLNLRKGEASPLWVSDIFELVGDNLDNTAHLLGMIEPINEIKAMLFANKGEQGIYSSFVAAYGKENVDSVEKWLRDIEDRSKRASPEESWIGRISSRTAGAMLSFRISTGLIQRSMFGLATNHGISHVSLLKALGSEAFTPETAMALVPKYSIEQLSRKSLFFRERYSDAPEMNIRDTGSVGRARKIMLRGKPGGSLGFRMMTYNDAWTASLILHACEIQYEEEVKSGKMTKEQVVQKAADIVNDTQASFDHEFYSTFLTNPSPMAKAMYGVFQSQQNAQRGEEYEAKERFKNAFYSKDKLGMLRSANQLAFTWFAYTIWSQGFKEVIMMIVKGEPPPEDPKKARAWFVGLFHRFVGNRIGLLPIIGPTANLGYRKMTGQYSADGGSLLPVGKLMGAFGDMNLATKDLGKGDVDKATMHLIESSLKFATLNGKGWENLYMQAKPWIVPEDMTSSGNSTSKAAKPKGYSGAAAPKGYPKSSNASSY